MTPPRSARRPSAVSGSFGDTILNSLIFAKPALAWTYPLGCAIAIIAVVRSLIHLLAGKQVVWKGTPYSGANQG